MQPILPMFAASVCQSVCLSRGSSRLHCAKMTEPLSHATLIGGVWGEHSCGPMEHCVRRELSSPADRERGPVLNFETSLLSSERLKLETWNFARTQRGGGPDESCAKIGHRGSGMGSSGVILNFETPKCLFECCFLASCFVVVRCKKRFFTIFYFGHVFLRFLKFFIFQTFFIFKNVGKVQGGKQINKKHFQNNSNEIDLWFFCCMSNDLKCLSINWRGY